MANKKYLLQTHPSVVSQDLKELPQPLANQFWQKYRFLFQDNPYQVSGLSNHTLKGRLKGYRALRN